MSSDKPSIQMIFSTQTQSTLKESNALSFYLEENQWSRLLELVNEYGNFEIYKETADKFLLKLGEHRFSVVRDFNKSLVSMLDISTMTPGAAELLAKIADLIFFDRKRRFMILASRVEHEQITWVACQKLDIPLKPADKDQAMRFQNWDAAYQTQNKPQFKSFSQSMLDNKPSNDPPSPGSQSNK